MLTKLEVEWKLRLFLPLHQDDDPEWYRAAGGCICGICGLQYRKHPQEQVYDIDHRLCNGEVVHL